MLANWKFTGRRIKLNPYFIPYKKINANWIKGLNVKRETIKLLEEKEKGCVCWTG